MANYEFKETKCYPSDAARNAEQQLWNDFGWEVTGMDTRQVFTHTDSQGTKHYSTSTYIQLRRDKEHRNYAKLAELQDTYFSTLNMVPRKPTPLGAYIFQSICCIPLFGLGIIFLLLIPALKKKIKKYNEAVATLQPRADAAREQAKQLV